MQICEHCNLSGSPTILMNKKLIELGIDPWSFYKSSPEERRRLILEHVRLEKNAVSKTCPQGLGLVVVKPEMFTHSSKIEKFMTEQRGLDIVDSQPFTYTPEAYIAVYEKLFTDYFPVFPHGSLLFLISISLPSRAILFRYAPSASSGDPQSRFNKMEKSDTKLSIRQQIVLPVIQITGFATMELGSCSGKCFDQTGIFALRTESENLRTFNGLHVPNDKAELDVTFSTLSDIITSWSQL